MSEQYKLIKHLNEGFDLVEDPKSINSLRKTTLVRITCLHQKGLDISLDNNPTCYKQKYNINGKSITLNVISIFKRTPYKNSRDKDIDGNPVIYALKQEHNYKFETPNSKKLLLDRFITILQSVFKNSGNDASVLMPQKRYMSIPQTGMIVPSSNELNSYIQKSIEEVNPDIVFIPKLLRKLDKEQIFALCEEPGSTFRKYLRKKYKYDEDDIEMALEDLSDDLDRIPGEKYKKHYVREPLRKAITVTMELNPDMISSYRENISGKDILLVDDTITYGQTIEEVLSIIYDTYSPKSVTVLTMFSKKFSN